MYLTNTTFCCVSRVIPEGSASMLDIAMQGVDLGGRSIIKKKMLTGEIEGVDVLFRNMNAGDTRSILQNTDALRVFFLLDGSIAVKGNRGAALDRRGAIVPSPGESIVVTAEKQSQWLEIVWTPGDDEISLLGQSSLSFPMRFIYEESKRYRDPFKSDRTVSRSIIDHHVLPKFAMGSVESIGCDRVEPHTHNLIAQFFFSFPENEAVLLVDGEYVDFNGYTLAHIPLGSDHGVQVADGKSMHYLWIDFLIDERGVAYLDEVHTLSG